MTPSQPLPSASGPVLTYSRYNHALAVLHRLTPITIYLGRSASIALFALAAAIFFAQIDPLPVISVIFALSALLSILLGLVLFIIYLVWCMYAVTISPPKQNAVSPGLVLLLHFIPLVCFLAPLAVFFSISDGIPPILEIAEQHARHKRSLRGFVLIWILVCVLPFCGCCANSTATLLVWFIAVIPIPLLIGHLIRSNTHLLTIAHASLQPLDQPA